MTPLEARKQLAQVDAGGRVSQDVAIAALEDVAGLRYEYAVQVYRPLLDEWLFIGPSGLWRSQYRARWYAILSTAEFMAIEKYPEEQVRVVARVYGQPVPVSDLL